MNAYYMQNGLTAGVWYMFKVRARNYIGLSPYSSYINLIAASVPLAPYDLTRVELTTSSVKFNWLENSDNGGSPVRDYLIYWDEGNTDSSVTDFVLSDHTSYSTLEHIQSGLTMGTYYRFWVKARNDAGVSERSETITLLAATFNTEPLNLRTTYQDEQTIT